jgi:hypothetical protein
VRARLSGDLPDGVMAGGHVSNRGSKAAGVMLYDEEGIERGGYVTQDTGSNVMLTLDSKYRQAALLVAGPDESQTSAMSLWAKGGSIGMRSDENGQRLTVTNKSGIVLQQPVIAALSPDTCASYKETEKKYPGERVCQSRYLDAACQACFDSK